MPLSFTTAEVVTASKMNLLAGYPAVATTLPGSPVADDETIYTDSLTAPTYYWHLRYNATLAKWLYIGGIPLFAEVTTSEATTSGTYAALATPGPSITIPKTGTYLITVGATASATSQDGIMSYDIGGSGAVDADAVHFGNVGQIHSASRVRSKAFTAADVLLCKYKIASSATFTVSNRFITVVPTIIS